MQHTDEGLVLRTALGRVAHTRGDSWQVLPDGSRRPVDVYERMLGGGRFCFVAPERDPSLPLVIDPGIVWSTYLGSSGGIVGDRAFAVATAENGDVVVVGKKDGPTFPMTPGTFQHPGTAPDAATDLIVTRLSNRGQLVYSSVIGGSSDQEEAQAVYVDKSGQATVAGYTFSSDFPTTDGAFDPVKDTANASAFVLRLSPRGDRLMYSTLLEGGGQETAWATSVSVDEVSGAAVVAGWANTGFPTTQGAWSETIHGDTLLLDGFVTRLGPQGKRLEWSTYFGGRYLDEIHGLVIDKAGTVTLTGQTNSDDFPTTRGAFDSTFGANPLASSKRKAFVSRLTSTGDEIEWSTYLGGDLVNGRDFGHSVSRAPRGGVYVAGTAAPSFPITAGAYQSGLTGGGGFVTRFGDDGSLLNSTLIVGPGSELINTIAWSPGSMVTLAATGDAGFPTTPGGVSTTTNGGWDAVVARLDPSLARLVYSAYVGGPLVDACNGMATDQSGRVTLVGGTSGEHPTTFGTHSPSYIGGQTDGFVTTLDLYLDGVEPRGESTPSCRRTMHVNVTEMPVAGADDFFFYCSGAPSLAPGFLALGQLRGEPVQRLGVDVWIDFGSFARVVPTTSDQDGYAEIEWPLSESAEGAAFGAQAFFRGGGCSGAGPWVATGAIEVSVQ